MIVLLGPIDLFGNYNLPTSSGKHLEEIYHSQIASPRYKLLDTAKDTDDLSIDFDRDLGWKQCELTNNKCTLLELCSEMFLVLQYITKSLPLGSVEI